MQEYLKIKKSANGNAKAESCQDMLKKAKAKGN